MSRYRLVSPLMHRQAVALLMGEPPGELLTPDDTKLLLMYRSRVDRGAGRLDEEEAHRLMLGGVGWTDSQQLAKSHADEAPRHVRAMAP